MKGTKKIQYKKWLYSIGIMSLLGITILFLPIWRIAHIEVTGNSHYQEEELLQEGGIWMQMHPLSLNKKEAQEKISQLTYVESAYIEYHFPNTLSIKIVENELLGYVPFHDSFLCIDKNGIVLEQSKNKRFALPTLEGFVFEYFLVGETLGTANKEKIEAAKEMMSVLTKYNFIEKVDSIDISNLEQIHLYVDKLNVIIGNIRDFDKKIKWLIKVNDNYSMGILDLSYIQHGQAVLTPLD